MAVPDVLRGERILIRSPVRRFQYVDVQMRQNPHRPSNYEVARLQATSFY